MEEIILDENVYVLLDVDLLEVVGVLNIAENETNVTQMLKDSIGLYLVDEKVRYFDEVKINQGNVEFYANTEDEDGLPFLRQFKITLTKR